MAAPAPLMPFLRPMSLPKPSTLRHFLRFSTSTGCKADSAGQLAEDRNLVASRTASPTYPPRSMKSLPRPKESHASHRTSHPRRDRPYPTRQATHAPVAPRKLIPEPVEPLSATQCAPNLPYFVTRTPSNELPIYTLRKRGGSLLQTRLKKLDGRLEVLRDELRSSLGLQEKEAVINQLTKHIILKGHHKPKVELFLRQRMF